LKIELSEQIFGKCPITKFHENPSNVRRALPCGRTDRHDEANSCFRNFMNTPKTQVM